MQNPLIKSLPTNIVLKRVSHYRLDDSSKKNNSKTTCIKITLHLMNNKNNSVYISCLSVQKTKLLIIRRQSTFVKRL